MTRKPKTIHQPKGALLMNHQILRTSIIIRLISEKQSAKRIKFDEYDDQRTIYGHKHSPKASAWDFCIL